MTERIYKCISEVNIGGVPQGMIGECMNLINWLMDTGYYNYACEKLSDRSIIDYMWECRGKVLEEV